MSTVVETVVHGETLVLLPERAVYWPRKRTLIVADLHFGKAAAFRAGGVAVPGGTTADMLARLDAALDRTGTRRLVCLGDFLHARAGRTPAVLAAFAAWRAGRQSLDINLIRGNHDRHAGDPPANWHIQCADEPVHDSPFSWRHEPPVESVSTDDGSHDYTICGHLHPAAALVGNGHGLTLPCFYFGRDFAVLPAFGEFTGTSVVRPRSGESVYVIAGDEIIHKEVSRTHA